jgi:hypothetical protein
MSSMRATRRNYEPEIYVEDITPKIAAEILTRNTHNRFIRQRHVDAMARDMANGQWRMTGESIKIAKDGTVLDGQHRLLAIVQSGITIKTAIVYNLDLDDQTVMDSGRARKFSDVLKIRGETYSTDKAALTRRIIMWEQGNIRSNTLEASRHELMDVFLSERDEIEEAVILAARSAKGMNVPRSVLSLAAYVLMQIDPEDAEDFITRAGDGQGIVEGDAIYALRRALHNREYSNLSGAAYQCLGLIFKAWNAYRDGNPVNVLTFRTGGRAPETLPVPK